MKASTTHQDFQATYFTEVCGCFAADFSGDRNSTWANIPSFTAKEYKLSNIWINAQCESHGKKFQWDFWPVPRIMLENVTITLWSTSNLCLIKGRISSWFWRWQFPSIMAGIIPSLHCSSLWAGTLLGNLRKRSRKRQTLTSHGYY